MTSIAKFNLNDCNGESHEYQVQRFTVDENAELQLLLGEPLLQAVSRAIGVLAPVMNSELSDAVEGGTLGDIAKALSGANWGIASDILTPIPKMVIEQGGPALVARILSKTIRKIPIEALKGQPVLSEDNAPKDYIELDLSKAADRDSAFGNGNMAEYWKAATMVLVSNFTPSGSDGFIDWKQAVNHLTGGLLTL